MGFLDLCSAAARAASTSTSRAPATRTRRSADRFSSLEALRDDGSPEAIEGLLGALHHPLRQVDRGRAGEGVGLRRADARWATKILPPLQQAPALGRLDRLGPQGAARGRRPATRRGRSSPICASATTTPTRATRRRRSSSCTTSASRTIRARPGARALPRGHGRGRALHHRRGRCCATRMPRWRASRCSRC